MNGIPEEVYMLEQNLIPRKRILFGVELENPTCAQLVNKWYVRVKDANGEWFTDDIPYDKIDEAFNHISTVRSMAFGPVKVVGAYRYDRVEESGQKEDYLTFFACDRELANDEHLSPRFFKARMWRANKTRSWSWLLGKY